MATRQRLAAAAASAALLGGTPAASQPFEIGGLEIGGATRFNIWSKSWVRTDNRPIDELEVDTVRLRADYDDGTVFSSVQYRYYIYNENRADSHFPHHAYIGWRLAEDRELTAGIQQVPFGLLPFASNNYFFSIAYYVGLEDDHDLGFTYSDSFGPWDLDLGYFIADEGSYFGASIDSARYSYDVVRTPNSSNEEEDQFNLRLARRFEAGAWSGEVGGSIQHSAIPNRETGRRGEHQAAALHGRFARGPFEIKLMSAAYDYNLENPAGQDGRVVAMGAYDFDYNVAADAVVHSAAFSYRFEPQNRWVDGLTVYNDYSILVKAESGFSDTQHNVLGTAVDVAGPLFVYLDLALGQHNAWIGPDFGNALAAGDGEGDWEVRWNLNLGLYF